MLASQKHCTNLASLPSRRRGTVFRPPHNIPENACLAAMSATRTVNAKALPRNTTKELDVYAAEFAKLVDRHSPTRSDTPAHWLRRLPDEAYRYFQEGVSTFGSDAQTPIERRGRLYLIHTALLFMWMSWGKDKARERFQCHANEGTRRAASLVTLEHYRRAGVLADFSAGDWFFQPVGKWEVSLISGAVDTDLVDDEELRDALQAHPKVDCDVLTLSGLRAEEAIPTRTSLSL